MSTVEEMLTRAKAHHRAGQLRDAEPLYRQILALDSTHVEVLRLLSAACDALGRRDEAIAWLRRAVNHGPDADTLNHLGALLAEQGKLEEAAASYRAALSANPSFVPALGNLASLLHRQGNLPEAVACCRRALALQPTYAELHSNLGAFLTSLGQLDEAVASCRRAIELKPQHVEAFYNLSRALIAQGKLDEASACCRQAIELRPDAPEGHDNLAFVLEQQGQLDEATTCLRQALALDPNSAEGRYRLAVALVRQHDLDEAVTNMQRVVELRPNDAEAHFTYAQLLLQTGRLAEGWREYEWRLQRPGHEISLPEPRWNGSALTGRTILLLGEQGFGDDLQMIRYAALVKHQGGTVVLGCRRPLARLLATCPGVDRVAVVGEAVSRFDVYAPLPSLPGIFRTSLETIPTPVPYVTPDADLVSQWSRELGDAPALKVGIAWQGNPEHPCDVARSIPLAHFAPIATLLGVNVVSLQMGTGREQLSQFARLWPITDLGDRLGDFYNTAAIVRNLDLVITCDSVYAHLAGALGVEVWVALAYSPDWRWMLERADSPWYPTMRLFRQNRSDDWNGVFQRIQVALAGMLESR